VRYVNAETGETVLLPADRVGTGMPGAASGTRVYFVVDDPTYDLSGAGDQLFLIGDGTALHGSPERSPPSSRRPAACRMRSPRFRRSTAGCSRCRRSRRQSGRKLGQVSPAVDVQPCARG